VSILRFCHPGELPAKLAKFAGAFFQPIEIIGSNFEFLANFAQSPVQDGGRSIL
jgi:hypothetical protein